MDLQNNWVGYLDRSAEQIKQSVKNRLISILPELYDESDNNPQNIIIDIFAGMTEMLNYYIDSYARESFIGTAQMYKSMVNLTRVIDYRIKTNYPPTVDLIFSLNQPSTVDVVIPMNTAVTDGNYNYLTEKEVVIPAGETSVEATASQRILNYMLLLGVSNFTPNQTFSIPSDYVQGTAQITVGTDSYKLIESFYNQDKYSKSFIVDVDEDKNIYVKFGDGLNGIIPPNNDPIYLTYESTKGSVAFATANTLTTILSIIPLEGGIELSVTNPKNSTMGVGIESIESIRRNAPLSVRTLNVAITRADIEDLAKSFPGIKYAYLAQGCGKEHNLYAAPEQVDNAIGNTLTEAIRSDLEIFLNQRIVFSNRVLVKPLQIAKIKISVDVYLTYLGNASGSGVSTESIYKSITTAINEKYGFNASRINNSIFISDIIYLIDDQDGVDHNDNLKLTMDPIYELGSEKFMTDITMLASDKAYNYTIYKQTLTSIIVKNETTGEENTVVHLFDEDVIYNDGIITFTWKMDQDLTPEDPSTWKFRVYPNNSNYVITDSVALPVIYSMNPGITEIRLHKQLSNGNWE